MDLPAIIYLLVFLLLIYKTKFFGLFSDQDISGGKFALFFFLKCLAIPAFCFIYKKMYGGIEKFDAGIFYSDAIAVNNLAWINFTEFLKSLFGLQDDSAGSYFYNHCIINTQNWDNGKLKDFFYNDNRIVIRVHAILHFIAFGSYRVHALFNCFLSYVGIFYLYRSFKEFFTQKETWLFLILCLFPTLWFYTGAISKEGLAIFVLGCTIYQLKKVIQKDYQLLNISWLVFLLFICVLLKPYLLCTAVLCFTLFFQLQYAEKLKSKTLSFFFIVTVGLISVNTFFIIFKNKSLLDVALDQQLIFSSASQGGIFLTDGAKDVRLPNDTTQICKVPGKNTYRISSGVSYIYWKHSRPNDTLFCVCNKDTISLYHLVSRVAKGGSNIPLAVYSKNSFSPFYAALYFSLFHPLFFNVKGPLQVIASFENLFIVLSSLVIFYGLFRGKRENILPVVFVFFALSLCLLIGISTPNSGAIFRYRSPVVIFILLAALYYVDAGRSDFLKSPD